MLCMGNTLFFEAKIEIDTGLFGFGLFLGGRQQLEIWLTTCEYLKRKLRGLHCIHLLEIMPKFYKRTSI